MQDKIGAYITNCTGETVCDLYFKHERKDIVEFDDAKGNAAHIVKCVNSHQVLFDTLKDCYNDYKIALEQHNALEVVFASIDLTCERSAYDKIGAQSKRIALESRITQIEAALALAGGESE